MKRWLCLIPLLLACCERSTELSYKVVREVPHDPECYTQGLEFSGGKLFESGGQYGSSSLREVNPHTGEILRKRPVSARIFAEGLTVLGGELFQLSWKENTVTVIDPQTFKFLRSHRYEGEGWGLCNNGQELIMSNGSNELTFRSPKDFSVIRVLEVSDVGKPLALLNELEWADGAIFANIYLTDRIARISPTSGKVTGWLDLSALRSRLPMPNKAEALNGIAQTPRTGHLLVTGKYWPKQFEIELED